MTDAQINADMAELDGWKCEGGYWINDGGTILPRPINYIDPERTHAERVMMKVCRKNRWEGGVRWYESQGNAWIFGGADKYEEVWHDATQEALNLAICEATLRAAGKWEEGTT